MEMNTIIGIVVAVVIMLVGLIMILRKPKPVEPSLEADLHVNPESQQPVIPRHVRDQLLQSNVAATVERVEPSFNTAPIEAKAPVETTAAENIVKASETDVVIEPEPVVELTSDANKQETVLESQSQDEVEALLATPEKAEDEKAETELSLNPNIATVEIEEFDGESNILDVHLHEQQRCDDESALATAEQIIALNVYPNPRRALSGDKALKVLLKYGLRFGEMSCFHRYNEDGTKLLFSVLQINDEGADGFDLETLSTEQVKGLAFFLALPHSDVQNAFDTMVSISGLIAREIDGTVYDQNHLEFTPQLREHWRHQAIDYRAGQASHA